MNVWMCGDTHFILSDNTFHLCSGFHAHHGATRRNSREETETQTQREEALLLKIVKQFLQNTF